MSRTRIASSSPSDLVLLSQGGQQIVRAYPQLRDELRSALGEAHAALLAEPVVGARTPRIDWYADGPAAPLSSLDPARRADVHAELVRLFDEVTAHAAYLRASGSARLASFLKDALRIPDLDALRVVDGRPVMIEWGAARSGQRAQVHPLELLRESLSAVPDTDAEPAATHDPRPPEPIEPVGPVDPVGPVAPVDPIRRSARWPIPLLALMLLVSGAATARTLLQSCGAGLPTLFGGDGGATWWDRCTSPADTARLEALVAAVEADIAAATRSCRAREPDGGASPDDPR